MNWDEVVTINPRILGGTPVFAGTRVPVESLIQHLQAGDTLEDFLDGFPSVRREQITFFLCRHEPSSGSDAPAGAEPPTPASADV